MQTRFSVLHQPLTRFASLIPRHSKNQREHQWLWMCSVVPFRSQLITGHMIFFFFCYTGAAQVSCLTRPCSSQETHHNNWRFVAIQRETLDLHLAPLSTLWVLSFLPSRMNSEHTLRTYLVSWTVLAVTNASFGANCRWSHWSDEHSTSSLIPRLFCGLGMRL